MIASPRSRRKGLAYEALILFMLYAITNLVRLHNLNDCLLDSFILR